MFSEEIKLTVGDMTCFMCLTKVTFINFLFLLVFSFRSTLHAKLTDMGSISNVTYRMSTVVLTSDLE